MRAGLIAVIGIVGAVFITSAAEARNKPCTRGKGGVVGCVGTKFLCRDGSTSASKRTCSRADAAPARIDIFTVRNQLERG